MAKPSSRSSPSPGSRTAALQWPRTSTSTSTVAPTGKEIRTGSPSRTAPAPSALPDLGQAPPQRAERVVRLGEEQRGELAARRRPLAEQQEGQHGPALAAAVAVPGRAVDLDLRPAEQLDREPRRWPTSRLRLDGAHVGQRRTGRQVSRRIRPPGGGARGRRRGGRAARRARVGRARSARGRGPGRTPAAGRSRCPSQSTSAAAAAGADGPATADMASRRRRSDEVPRSAMRCAASSSRRAAVSVGWRSGATTASARLPRSNPRAARRCHHVARACRRRRRRRARLSSSIRRPGRRSPAAASPRFDHRSCEVPAHRVHGVAPSSCRWDVGWSRPEGDATLGRATVRAWV